MPMTMSDVAEAMRDIDFCTLATVTDGGAIAARPMSNNRDVAFDGDAWFFSSDDTRMAADITANPQVGVTYLGSPGIKAILGAPGAFYHVEGRAELVRDKAQFAAHWHKSLERWYQQGIDTPGLLLVRVRATRIHY
ncbi:MAG: pyridoxamine 5'-phosphate oxidase family protein [Novosphingobium sp.]